MKQLEFKKSHQCVKREVIETDVKWDIKIFNNLNVTLHACDRSRWKAKAR